MITQNELHKMTAELEKLRAAVATAYGYLWHVNNEPGTPNQYPPERAAYEARKVLRDLMTQEQRGNAINKVREVLMPVTLSSGRAP